MSLLIRSARIWGGEPQDILTEAQAIVSVMPRGEPRAARELDVEGRLVLPAFVNCHWHADKCFYLKDLIHRLPGGPAYDDEQLKRRFASEMRSGMAHFELKQAVSLESTWAIKRTYTVGDIADRAGRAVELAVQHGCGAIRLFADVDRHAGVTGVKGLLEIKRRYGHFLHLQVVAFPQEGIFANPGTAELMREALDAGADVVGGIPWVEWDDAAQRRHVDACFQFALAYDRDIHMLCDDTEDPSSRTLEYLAIRTIETGWQGRVSASHCCALSFYHDAHARKVIELVRQAGITVVSNAQISLVDIANLAGEPRPRGITRVRELLAAGVNVASAQDDVDDWYYPWGRNDLLEVAFFMAHTAQFFRPEAMVIPFRMITEHAARAMRLPNYGVAPGCEANLVVLDATTLHEAFQYQAARRYVVLKGRIVAETRRTTTLTLE
jgi:cytosine/creatinine deaminase